MIAKLIKGNGLKGVLAYLVDGKEASPTARGQVILTNMASNTPKSLAREFGQLRSLRSGLNKAVFHASISLSPEDRQLSDSEFSAIAEQFLDEMGYQDSPFVVVRHHDTDHQHIHIVASRITVKGEVVSDAHDFRRAETVMRKLEEQYGLHPPAERMINQKQQGGSMNNELRTLLEQALANSEDIQQFIAECKKRGIDPLPHIQGKKISGLAFRFKKKKVKGSDLGKKYGWNHLSVALNYDSDKHFHHLVRLKEQEDNDLPQISNGKTDEAEERNSRRALLEDTYETELKLRFNGRIQELSRDANSLNIKLRNGVSLKDYGSKITGEDGSAEALAKEMVALAIHKGWSSIQLKGNDEFVRLAMLEALKAGLDVLVTDEWQQVLLEEAKRAMNPQGTGVSMQQMLEVLSPDGIKRTLDTIRKDAGVEHTDPEQTTPRNKPRFK
jgi:hypothetical protein